VTPFYADKSDRTAHGIKHLEHYVGIKRLSAYSTYADIGIKCLTAVNRIRLEKGLDPLSSDHFCINNVFCGQQTILSVRDQA